jgi:hypothetical protein
MLKFNFILVQLPQGEKFFVSVLNDQHLEASFEMRREKDHTWIILPPFPNWVIPYEEQLSTIVNERMSS